MIVMVSMKTLSARLPDHRASTKPSEMTSNRPPLEHVVQGRLDDLVDGAVGEQPAGEVEHRVAHLVDLAGVELAGDVADRRRPAPKTSGGTESTAKNAASAARPVTR